MKKIITTLALLSFASCERPKERHCGTVIKKYTDGRNAEKVIVFDSAGVKRAWHPNEFDFINTGIGDKICILKELGYDQEPQH